MFSYMTHNHSTISIHNHSTLLGLGLENDGKQISNCLQGKLDRLWTLFCVSITFCGDYYILRRNNIHDEVEIL